MFTLKRIVFLWCPYEKLGIVRTQIHYVTLHFRDRESAASLRYRNRTKITVFIVNRGPIRYGFLASAKAIRYIVNIAFKP